MGLSFEQIRDLQRKEKNSVRLAEAGDAFYRELAAYVKDCTASCRAQGNGFRELENSMKLARDAFDKREQKIVMKALRSVRTKEYDEENMTAEEKALYTSLVGSIRSNRALFDNAMLGEYSFKAAEDTLIKENGNNQVLARIRKEMPVFVGSDTKEYGPFKAGDVVKMPRAEADLLANQGLVEIM